jgi:hypothetical protein
LFPFSGGEIICQLHDLATLSLGKAPHVPIGKGAGTDSEPVWTLWRNGKQRIISNTAERRAMVKKYMGNVPLTLLAKQGEPDIEVLKGFD